MVLSGQAWRASQALGCWADWHQCNGRVALALGGSVWRVIPSPSPCCVIESVCVMDTERVCTVGDRGTFIRPAGPALLCPG